MSIGHSSSAYSLAAVMPSGRVIAAATMISCQPQKWTDDKMSDASRAFANRCVE